MSKSVVSKFDGFKLAEEVLGKLHGHLTSRDLIGVNPVYAERFTDLFKHYYVIKSEYGDKPEGNGGGNAPPSAAAYVAIPEAYLTAEGQKALQDWDNVKVGGTLN